METQKVRDPPVKLSGYDIFEQVENIKVIFGKKVKVHGRGKRKKEETKQWTKRSIFFELPYWKSNVLRHNLDFMHIEKIVCENIMYNLLKLIIEVIVRKLFDQNF